MGILNQKRPPGIIAVDIHSHLLPGIDDGVNSLEESLLILEQFEQTGFRKVITTPHISKDVYPNTPEIIMQRLEQVRTQINQSNLKIEIEAAAEYYFDEYLFDEIDGDSRLMTFGENYLLFETSFMNLPVNLEEFIFKANSNGYKPVMAHPERYAYLNADFELVEKLHSMGTYFQININSLAGYYSKPVRKFAEKLFKHQFASFLGSDCHNMEHFVLMTKFLEKKSFLKTSSIKLLNNTL